MAWIDADEETVNRECTPKNVQEAFERKWKRDAYNEKRVVQLEDALRQAIETIQKAVNAFPSPSAEVELIELRKVLEGK